MVFGVYVDDYGVPKGDIPTALNFVSIRVAITECATQPNEHHMVNILVLLFFCL